MKKSDIYSFESIWSQSGLKEFKYREGKFSSYYSPYCTYPLSSPVFGKGRFSQKDIDSLESHFKAKRKGQKAFIFFEGRVGLKNWEKRGYQARELNVCYLTQYSKEVELPKGYSFGIIKFSSKKGKDIYREVACKAFGLDENFLSGFHKLCKKMSPDNHLIVIFDKRKLPVALTGVVSFGKISYLHSACVFEKHQGKGLSRWMLKKSIPTFKLDNLSIVIFTSSNPRMIGQAEVKKRITFLSRTTS